MGREVRLKRSFPVMQFNDETSSPLISRHIRVHYTFRTIINAQLRSALLAFKSFFHSWSQNIVCRNKKKIFLAIEEEKRRRSFLLLCKKFPIPPLVESFLSLVVGDIFTFIVVVCWGFATSWYNKFSFNSQFAKYMEKNAANSYFALRQQKKKNWKRILHSF